MTAPTKLAAPARCHYGSGWKRRYRTQREAELAAWRELVRRGCWLRGYRCRACSCWHLSHWVSVSHETEGEA